MIALSRVIIPHSKDCRCKSNEVRNNWVWSGIIVGDFHGTAAANEKATRGKNHHWYKVSCNDPKCPAIKAVHSSVLANA